MSKIYYYLSISPTVSTRRRRNIKMLLSVGPQAEKFNIATAVDARDSATFLF